MKHFLIFLFCLLTIEQTQSQKKVSVYIYKGMVSNTIVKKVGKKPKNAKVGVEIYYLIHEVPEKYHTGKFIQFIKYIESYKGKRIREVIYDTGVLPRNRSIVDNPTTFDELKSYESITDFNKICCVLNNDTHTFSFRRNLVVLKTDISKSYPKIDVDGSFYNTISQGEFLNYLNKNNIDGSSIKELISLNKYANNKFGNKGEFEDKIAELSKKNSTLSKELVKWIPNYKSAYDNNYRIDYTSKQTENGIKLFSVLESYSYDSDLYDDHKIENKKRRLLIKFPKGHKYEGEVYLKSVDSINRNHSNYLKVYKSNTKTSIPFKNLYVINYYYGAEIYGLKGSLNNEFIVNGKVRKKAFTMPQTDFLILKSNNKSKKKNLELEVEEKRFVNHYLKTEITSRRKSYQLYKQGLDKAFQAKIDQYDRLKKESIKKNGFFLVTKDYRKNIKDRSVNTLLRYLYEGKFYELRSYDWVDDGLLLQTLDQFMRKKYQKCGNSGLTKSNITQIYDKICAKENVTKNGFGVVLRRNCVEWSEKPSGIYTSKRNYNTYKKLELKISKKAPKKLLEYLGDRNEIISSLRINREVTEDLNKIFKLNNCNNKSVKRFEDNLIRYINDDEPLQIGKPYDYRNVNYGVKQDLNQLVIDLIKGSEYFKHGLKYKENSLTELKITNSLSKQVLIGKGYVGKPNKIVGKFKYFNTYKYESNASIEIVFNKKGIIKCIYLWSITNVKCLQPNVKVISDLKAGKYIIGN